MRIAISRIIGCVVAASFVVFPLTTLAQIEEVIVTAQKREQSLQDVPIALQAFTGEQIRNLGIQRASDVVMLAPNMAISQQNNTNQSIAIRGIGTSDFFGAAPGSVGIYMDEVTMSSPYLTSVGLYDMERVEVLRGPQNTLFGRNTTGGAVNFISTRPEVGGDMDGFIDFTYVRFDRIEVEAGATFQLGDTAAVRIAGKSFDRDGVWNDLDAGGSYGDKDRKSIRGTVVWEPSEVTTVTLNGHWGEEDSEVDLAKVASVTLSPNGAFVGPQIAGLELDWENLPTGAVNSHGLNTNGTEWNDIYPTGANRHDMDAFGFYLKLEHDFGWAKAVSITAYDDSEVFANISSSGTGNTRVSPISGSPEANIVIDMDQSFEQFSQEIRLQSPDDQRFRWIGGFYYFQEDFTLGQNIAFGPGQILSAPFGPPPPIGAPPGPPVTIGGSLALWNVSQGFGQGFVGAGFTDIMPFSIATMENDVWSPYFQADFDILENVTINLGVRYTEDTKEMKSYEVGIIERSGFAPTTFFDNDLVRSTSAAQLASGLASATCTDNGRLCADTSTRPDLKATEWGGKAGLTWQITDDHMFYGHYSRGFRSGKFDIEFLHGIHTGFGIEDAVPETLDAYEVGVKTNWFDNSVQLNISAFLYDWFNKQSFFVSPVTGPAFSNVPKSESKGLEFELKWAPTHELFFAGSVGLLDTEVTEASGLPSDELGHELQNAPSESFNLFGSWTRPVGSGTLHLQANFNYRAEAKNSLATIDLVETIDKVELLGVRGSYSFGPDERYQISVFGEDLLASKYCKYQFSLQAINGTVTCNASEGRAMWGLTAGMRFN